MDIAVNFDKNLEIYYWNDDNTDVFSMVLEFNHLIKANEQEGVSGRK
jgi:hypothetical protein